MTDATLSTRGNCGQAARLAPAVAGLVEVEAHAVACQVDDVGGARAVDVGQADAPLVELIGVVEPGRVVHRDLGAEAAVAEVRPVADLAVADAHEVGEAVAAHVGEVDGLRAVGEDEPRALLLVQRLGGRCAPGRSPSSASDGYQVKTSSSVIRTSAWPSPSRSTNRRFGSSQCDVGQLTRTARNGSQLCVARCARRSPDVGPANVDQVELAVAGQVEELLAPAAQGGQRRLRRRRVSSGAEPAAPPRFGL